MPIIVRQPTQDEIKLAETWPIWAKEVSEFPWVYTSQETCLVIDGRAEVTTSDGETVSFKTGDWVIFPPDLKCQWKIIEPVVKKYNFG